MEDCNASAKQVLRHQQSLSRHATARTIAVVDCAFQQIMWGGDRHGLGGILGLRCCSCQQLDDDALADWHRTQCKLCQAASLMMCKASAGGSCLQYEAQLTSARAGFDNLNEQRRQLKAEVRSAQTWTICLHMGSSVLPTTT